MTMKLIQGGLFFSVLGIAIWVVAQKENSEGQSVDVDAQTIEVETAEAALDKLKAGNQRFVSGNSKHPHESADLRSKLLAGQHPFAVVVGCSDSRVPPDLLFDCGFGELFVIRVAGNVVDTDELASIEYAVDHLDTKLVVVLGHTGCGAVTAAMDDRVCEHEPKEICDLVQKIRSNIGDYSSLTLDQAVSKNVQGTTASVSMIADIQKSIAERGVIVQPAIYHMESGVVEWIQ